MNDRSTIETELEPRRGAELIEAGAELVDVRRPFEYEAGHLAGARNIEINKLSAAADSIARERPVLFCCRTGDRSGMAAQAFREAGYDAYNLAGGIVEWVAAGLPIEPAGGEVVTPPPPS
jgi:hydroxyacylglutathione hydrolase/adenylyltransferase/sulfurtransferase